MLSNNVKFTLAMDGMSGLVARSQTEPLDNSAQIQQRLELT
ncbi:hypothetical protein LQF76_07440 [Gloeomargaritales cyanobacterium VI4D9]|nr:hypothetical protein LQF76_07440 [Gloeomargaritales cyanobacterium VI4D9]